MNEKIELLRDFNEKVGKLERSRFAQRYRDAPPQVVMKFEEFGFKDLGNGRFSFSGKAKTWVPDFEEDEIDAFVLTYRLLTQNNDRLSLANLARIYASDFMHPEAAENYQEAKSSLNETLNSASSISIEDGFFTVRTIVEVVLYGDWRTATREKPRFSNHGLQIKLCQD